MKNLMLIGLILLTLNVNGQNDYVVKIGSQVLDISLDKEYELSLNGTNITFSVSAKDTLLYIDDDYSFKYFKDYKVSKTQIDEGIEQIMLMTAEGSGIIIQKYSSINPTMLIEIMINEVTKESINYGFELDRTNYRRTLKSGQIIDINRAVLTYKDDINIYEVASIGQKDEGILILTMIMNNNMSEQGQKLINLMWGTLNYK